MPYYEFYSPDTNTVYTFFARSLAYSASIPRCPDAAHPAARMIKRPSRFAFTGRAKEESGQPFGNELGDAQMERAMAALEQEFGGLDEHNPDPRHLGRLMRRMSDLTGETLPPEMEEMTRRLEAGEDPEKLEEEFGDAFGDEEPGLCGMGAADPGEPPPDLKSRIVASLRTRAPLRDTAIYEMADWV